MMWRPRLPSPFGTTFLGAPTLDLHQCSRTGKSSWRAAWNGSKRTRSPTRMRCPRPWTRIVGLAPDGNHVLVASDTYNLILARILGSQPQPLEEADLELATKTLQQLLFRAAGARQSHTYSPLEMEQAIRDREEWILSGSIEAPMSWQWPTSGGIGNQGRSKPNCRHLRERWNNT